MIETKIVHNEENGQYSVETSLMVPANLPESVKEQIRAELEADAKAWVERLTDWMDTHDRPIL